MVSGPVAVSSSWGASVGSFLQNLFHPDMAPSMSSSPLGTLWQAQSAAKELQMKRLKSESDPKYGKSLRVTFRNCGTDPLIVCWLDEKGKLHHFDTLEPTDVILGPITKDDHTESTWTGHAFLLAHCGSSKLHKEAVRRKSLSKATIVGAYRPTVAHSPDDPDQMSSYPLHVVTIQKRPSPNKPAGCFSMCMPKKQGNLRKRKKGKENKKEEGKAENGDDEDDGDDDGDDADMDDDDDEEWFLSVSTGEIDPTPLDTTDKKYKKTYIGGWPVKCEACWHGNDQDVKKQLERDMNIAGSCFPTEARKLLKKDTYIWVNRSLTYGPAACPEVGSGLCFHPDPNWLVENGCHAEKGKCVELYDIVEYCETSEHWGPGGVLIHELSHAYHNKFLPEGYDNPEIEACYQAAMKEGLYDCVRVHGTQGPEARAYACQDAMEYFAELSTAFLGGLDDTEYNKWYPFNRKQLKEHDPRAYELLKRVWKIDNC
jgi:hypothetical protein